MTKPLYLLLIPFLIAALTGCEDSEEISDSQDASNYAVKMGGIFPFSGALSSVYGKPLHQSALLAIKHLAEAGYSVGWVVGDSKSDPYFGVEAARELIEKGNIQVLIGATSSNVTISIAEQLTIPNQIPQISYVSGSYKITDLPADEGQDFLFRLVPSDRLQGTVLAKLAFDTGYQRASTLYIDNPYGQSLNEIFAERFTALGGTVVAAIPHQELVSSEFQGGESYQDELQRANPNFDSEVLVAISYPQHAKVYLQEAIDNNYFKEFLFVHGTKVENILDTTVGTDKLDGMCGTAPGGEVTESTNIFLASYEIEYGEEPTVLYLRHVYDAIIVAGLAAYAAQAIGEEVTPIIIREYLRRVNDPNGQKVIAGVEGLKRAMKMLDSGLTINYEGASGNVDFDENGDVYTPIEIWCYEDGTIKSRELCTVDFDTTQSAQVECNKL